MKRVLVIVNTGLLNAGVPRIMMDIFEKLYNEYQFDFVVCSGSKGYFDDYLIKKGSRIFYIGANRPLNWKEEHMFSVFVRSLRLFRILFKSHYDIVHSNSGFVSGEDMLISWLCGIKKRITHAHGTYELPSLFVTRFYHKAHLILIKLFATHRIAVSRIAGESLFNGKHFDLILNSIDLDLYRNIKPMKHDCLNLLQVGYFCTNKNQLFTLQCLKESLKSNKPIHLYFIGFEIETGYLNKMQTFIKDNSLSEFITILPHDYNKFELYPFIDYAVIPSFTEGLCISALECQAAGIQCIASYGIPNEADMGLLKHISLASPKEWANYITADNMNNMINEQKVNAFDRNKFIENIRYLYNC